MTSERDHPEGGGKGSSLESAQKWVVDSRKGMIHGWRLTSRGEGLSIKVSKGDAGSITNIVGFGWVLQGRIKNSEEELIGGAIVDEADTFLVKRLLDGVSQQETIAKAVREGINRKIPAKCGKVGTGVVHKIFPF